MLGVIKTNGEGKGQIEKKEGKEGIGGGVRTPSKVNRPVLVAKHHSFGRVSTPAYRSTVEE